MCGSVLTVDGRRPIYEASACYDVPDTFFDCTDKQIRTTGYYPVSMVLNDMDGECYIHFQCLPKRLYLIPQDAILQMSYIKFEDGKCDLRPVGSWTFTDESEVAVVPTVEKEKEE